MAAYNAEKTIKRAIDSCVNQTYSDIEIIVVDDGSVDNTTKIVEDMAYFDSRIKLIKHSTNLGVGVAKRTGIKAINGEAMTFCDSDDLLKPDCIMTLVNEMKASNVDVIGSGMIVTDEHLNVIKEKIPERKLLVGGNKFKSNTADTMRYMAPMLIKSHLWKKAEQSDRTFIEDTQTLIQILYYANAVLTIPYAGYYYTQNPKSLCHTCSPGKSAIHTALCAKDIMEFFKGKVEALASSKGFLLCCDKVFKTITKEDEVLYKDSLEELKEGIKNVKHELSKK